MAMETGTEAATGTQAESGLVSSVGASDVQQQLDLSRWMGRFHNNEIVGKPYVIPPILGGVHGIKMSSRPHSIALAHDQDGGPAAAIAHEGILDELIIMPITDGMIRWAATTFFATPGLVRTSPMAMDGFVRWCEEPGEPKLHTCDHCDGTLLEPGEKPESENMRLVCQHCDGSGLDGDITDGYAKIGPVTVDRRMLRSVYKHLRGSNVAFAWAPSLDRPGTHDAHVRVFSTGPKGEMVWGAWRILLADVGVGGAQ